MIDCNDTNSTAESNKKGLQKTAEINAFPQAL
jgi:hypothetical protein